MEVPEFKGNTSVHERLAGAVGHLSRVSGEGKAGPLEAGRGKYSPPANPERVTAGASERRGAGVLLPRSKKGKIFKDYENTRCESPETPVKQILRKDIFTPTKKGEHVVNMVKKYLVIMAIIPIVLVSLSLTGSYAGDKVPPRVIATNPQNGARDVDPSIKEISVTFNERMMDKSWSWCYEDRDTFPQMTGQPYYVENNTKNVLPVNLEPNKEYVIWINTVNFENFRDEAGIPAVPYKFTFKTR